MPPRYPTNPHRVTLDLDPITSDALTRAAKTAKSDRQRLAYEFIQRGLGIGMSAPEQAAIAQADDSPPYDFNRAFAPFNKPKGTA